MPPEFVVAEDDKKEFQLPVGPNGENVGRFLLSLSCLEISMYREILEQYKVGKDISSPSVVTPDIFHPFAYLSSLLSSDANLSEMTEI